MKTQQPRISARKVTPAHCGLARNFLPTVIITLCLLPSVSVAALEWERSKETILWLLLGYSFDARTKVGDRNEEVVIAAIYPTWPLGGLSLGRWRGELNVETIVGSRVNGNKGVLVGVGPGIRVGYLVSKACLPYVDLSAGLTYNDMGLEGMGSRFNFSEQAGGGLEVRVWKSLSLRGEYRFMHLSNAGLADQNGGLSVRTVLAGFLYSF